MAGCEPGRPLRRIAVYVKDSIRERSPDLHASIMELLGRSFDIVGPGDAEAAVSIGGDGTFLALARALPEDTPVLGVNMGRRGAVTDALPEDLPLLVRRLREGSYCVEDRMKLEASTPSGSYEVINDLYLNRRYEGPTPTYSVRYDSSELYSGRMDGLIVSTPTGSTGYNLSAGGPVLHETASSIVVTPVLPLARIPPVVLQMDGSSEVEVESSSPIVLLLDGQLRVDSGARIVRVVRSEHRLRVIRLRQVPFQHLRKTLCQQ
ncbi:MAG: NAD(+)/NADH kinase [Conexivisphaera sp.]